MGKTLVIFKIVVSDMGFIEEVEKSVRDLKTGEVRDVKRTPIGFGIEEIKAAILIPEKQDEVLDNVTAALQKIPHVENVEIESMTLL